MLLPRNWMHLSRHLSFKEKLFIFLLIFVFFGASLFWSDVLWKHYTDEIPDYGGEYAEGAVGSPLYINPLLSQTNDADADLSSLVYSGLFQYDSEGKIINDLAESYEISEDGKIYTVRLKQNILWHDGEKMTADDVIFTIKTVQDPAFRNFLRQSWQNVDIEKADDFSVRFSLKNPYSNFLNKLTLGILPKHIWAEVGAEKFSLAEYNLKPVGTGPYMFDSLQKDSQGNVLFVALKANEKYYGGVPYISKFTLNFYPDEDSMIESYNRKEIKGMSNIAAEKLSLISAKATMVKELGMPRYFALLFNQNKSAVLADKEVREALAYGINREELLSVVLNGKGKVINSPLLPGMNGYREDFKKMEFDPEKARKILDDDGWKINEEKGAREKDGKELTFKIYTRDWPQLSRTVELMTEQWKKIGARVEFESLDISDFQQNYIRPREYDSILIGQDIGFGPDLYSYWHSSQKDDPGFNLALFKNNKADELLEEIRQQKDEQKIAEKYGELQALIAEEIPGIFLYSNYYLYPLSNEVGGMEVKNIASPSGRFADVERWFIETKRILKK